MALRIRGGRASCSSAAAIDQRITVPDGTTTVFDGTT
jgi:hypothetical protein